MGLRELFRSVGLAAAVLGVGASVAVCAGACADDQEKGVEPTVLEGGQVTVQPRLPSLDLEAPPEFQTATFAFG